MTITDVTDATIAKVGNITSAMLSNAGLRAIYEASLGVSRGVYVEIGPAQGGSTLAIALGRRSAGREAMIYTADVFTGSSALKTDDVGINVAILRSNLAELGVGENVRIVVVPREDIATTVPPDAEIGLLFIDADGAIDRDFAQFYDRILPGGQIILDDFEDKISGEYLQYSDEALQKYVRNKHAHNISELNPFGKHYMVYQFAQALVGLGLIEAAGAVANTGFFRKVGRTPYAQSGAPEGLAEIRAAIAREFFERREKLAPTAVSG
jgi:predicted O-methyltransferase YrrM